MKAILPTAYLVALISTLAPGGAQAAPASRVLWEQEGYRFTPKVEAAYLTEAKAAALAKLKAEGKELPADFLAWIDSDPVVKTTVYGARRDASGVLAILRSLELDLGKAAVRGQWTQLALAMAVAHGKADDSELARADLSPRQPLVLQISGDPRVRVDTHAKDRPLDVNDHIVNFLEDTQIEEEVVVGWKEPIPELKYDAKGVAIPQPKAKAPKEAIKEKRKRSLRAADVIGSEDLEKQFNAYMAAHGHPETQVHCGPQATRLNWNSHDAKGADQKGIRAAFDLFLEAYKAKGLFPKDRDPVPTLGERCAFLIRNFGHVFTDEEKTAKKITWPLFPSDKAPWPILTMWAMDAQPLRERQDAWERYRDKGELHRYGEYIGNIAQNAPMQNARRLAPFAFNYGGLQMMLKDGGVCGTMANISVRSQSSLGVPSSTAGQPGHCALVMFGFDPKTNTWNCHGGQYVTAGDSGTGVHVSWVFGDTDARRKMVYHQSVAQSVNYGLQSFLDAQAAHAFYMGVLTETDRKIHGATFLTDATAKAPYAMFLADDVTSSLDDPAQLAAWWRSQKTAFPKDKPGCPQEGLYQTTLKDALFARLAALPAPKDQAQAKGILDFLTQEQCTAPVALSRYKAAAQGLPALLAETETAFKAHLNSERTDAACNAMAGTLSAAAATIADPKVRAKWVADRFQEIEGHEMYAAIAGRAPKRRMTIATDASIVALSKMAKRKLRPNDQQLRSLSDAEVARLDAYLDAERTPAAAKEQASRLTFFGAAIAKESPAEAKRAAEELAKAMTGHETFIAKVNGKDKEQRDPSADAIAKLATSVN